MKAANDSELPRTRAEAKAKGADRYFTGKPCKRGHVDLRVTKTGTCMECSREKTRQWVRDNPEKKKEQDKAYAANNKERIAERLAEWKAENPDYMKEWFAARPHYHRDRRRANPEKSRETAKRSYEKISSTAKGKVSASVRAGVVKGIRKGSKSARKTFELLGYTVEQLMEHLEKQFKPGMSWDNYGIGGWHIDHIIPLAAHNYNSPDDLDFKRAWALSNLQPLWARDNISKHAKLIKPFQPSLAFGAPTNDNAEKDDEAA